jgi:CYTH domain-containing protein
MAQEIERKFLVSGDFMPDVYQSDRIVQGYICSDKARTVRVRIRGGQGFLTIKGISTEDGLSRYEFEKEISLQEAEELLLLCESGVIDKVRHLVQAGKHTIEVDVFAGANQGLVMAEVELSEANEVFESPHWLGVEVTGDCRYYNSYLSNRPFIQWVK